MSEAQRLAILITADGGAYEAAMKTAQSQVKGLIEKMGLAGREGAEAGKQSASAWDRAKGVFSSAADGLAKLGLAAMGLGAIKRAAESAIGAVMGVVSAAEGVDDAMARVVGNLGAGLAATIDGHAKLATTLGMSEQAYLAAAGAAGQYLLNLGVGKDAAANMAMGMTELAPKLAAFNDMDPQQVTDALQKGIGGATRGLKELGVNIDANAISKMSAAQRAAYIYGEVLKQTGPAQQGWVDNQGDVANSIATMHAIWDNAKASLGKLILPVVAPWAAAAAEGVGKLAQMLGPIGGIIKGAFGHDIDAARESFKGLGAIVGGPVGEAIGALAHAAGSLGGAFSSFLGGNADQGFADIGSAVIDAMDAVSRLTGLDVSGIKKFLFGDDLTGGAWKTLTDTIKTVFDVVQSSFETGKGIVTNAMSAIGGAIGNVDWSGILSTLVEGFNNARPGVEAFIAAVVDRFTYFKDEILPPVIEFITGTLIPAFADFGQRAAAGFAIVAPFVTMLAAKFMEFGNAVIEKVWPVLKKVLGFISDHSGVFVTLGAVIAMVAGGPITMIVGALALIGTIVPSVIAWFEGVKTKMVEMGDALGAKVEAIKSWWQDLQSDTAAKWQAIKDAISSAVDTAVAWIQEKFQAAKDFVKSIQDGIKNAILAVWNQIPADIRARLVEIYDNIVTKFEAVRTAAVAKWEAVKAAIVDAISGAVEWVKAQAQLMYDFYIQPIIDLAAAVRTKFEEVKQAIIERLTSLLEPVRQKWAEIKTAIVDRVSEIADGVREKFNEVRVAITTKLTEAKTAAGDKAREILTTLMDPFKNIYADITKVGKDLLDGLRQGISNSWATFKDWFWNKIRSIVGIGANALEEKSPSRAFARIGEYAVDGLYIGFQGLKEVGNWIQKEMVGWVKDKDIENFGSIAALTGHMVEIFTNTTAALKALLSFDVSTSAGQINAQFDALVGTFETALLRMKGLAQYAGRGDSPDNFLNMFDVQNIEIVSKGIQATIQMVDGLLGIVDKMGSVKLPETGGIAALLPYLQELGNVAAQFIDSVGSPEGEDATAWFTQGASTAAAIAAWAKSIAEIVGLKVGALASDFAVQMSTLATASAMAWDALKATALDWGGMGVTARDQLLVGIKAYAEAVVASLSILKGSAELKIDEATLATTEQIGAAARVGNDALTKIGQLADWWIRMPQEAERAVAGIKAYVEAGTAAAGLLKAGGDLDLSGATEANLAQMAIAGNNARLSESLVRALADGFVTAGAAWREKVVPALKEWTDSAKASIDILTAGGALAIDKVIVASLSVLAAAGENARKALSLVQGLAQGYADAGAAWRAKVVPAIKDWADSAGVALKLLVDTAGVTTDWSKVTAFLGDGLQLAGDNAAAMLGVVQALALTWAGLSDSATIGAIVERVKAFADGAGSALRILVDAAGVTTDWSKVTVVSATGIMFAGASALLMLTAVQALADVWAGIATPEVLKAIVDRVKAFADGAGSALRILVDVAGITTDFAKVTVVSAAGLEVAGANASVLLAAAERLSSDWVNGRSVEDMKGTSDRIKLWGESAGGAAKAFADAAGSFATLVKAKWPADLSGAIARVGIAMTAVLSEFSDIYDRLKKQGKDLDKASSVSTLVGGAAEAVGKVFETFSLEKLMKNPLVDSKIRSGWGTGVAARRLDHLALKMADGVKRAVNALINGLKDVVVPTGLASGLDALVSVYERLLDTLERLSATALPDASKIGALLAALGYVPGTPAGGSAGGGGIRGVPVPGGEVTPFRPPAPPPSMGTPYQPPSVQPQPGVPSPTPGPGPSPNITVQLTNEIKIGLDIVARAMQMVSNVKAMDSTHAPVGA